MLASNKDVNFNAVMEDVEKYLTRPELAVVNEYKSGEPQNHTDLILELGYTGRISREHINCIVGAVVVSLYSRRLLVIKELHKGLELFGVAEMINKYPDAARSLFVVGGQIPVDANYYLVSALAPEYSKEGSTHRTKEEEIIDHFQDFIISLEDEKVSGYEEAVVWKSEDGDEDIDLSESKQEGERYLFPINSMMIIHKRFRHTLFINFFTATPNFNHIFCEYNF